MIKLQKQLTERSGAVTELEGRFLQLQEVSRVCALFRSHGGNRCDWAVALAGFPVVICRVVLLTLVSAPFRVRGR